MPSGSLQMARETERAHIAREIHDTLGQSLTGMKLQLCWLRGRLRGSEPELESAA